MFVSRIRKTYYLFFTDQNGVRRKVTTKTTSKSQALFFQRNFDVQSYLHRQYQKSIAFSKFKSDYLLYAISNLTPKSFRTYQCALNEAIRIIGDISIASVDVRTIEKFLSIKKVESSIWTARKYYICLKAVFQKGVDWGLIGQNPFKKVKIPKTPEVLPTYLSPDEFNKLLLHIKNQNLKILVIAAMHTGLRLGELRTLKWTNINFHEKTITILNTDYFQTKGKRIRIIPVDSLLLNLLTTYRENRLANDWVFTDTLMHPLKENTISKEFKKAVRLSGINPKAHFHTLRHSFASALVKEGISLYAVQKLLGHRSIKTTEIYSHLSPDQLHKEVEIGLRTFNK